MLHIGCHLSSSKGYRHMGEDALSIKADTFQFFTRNPRGSKAKKADPKDAEALRGLMEEHAFAPVLGHAPYTLNACALDEGLRAFARDAMREDVMTLDTYLPHMLYNFHPGSHVGQGIDAGMALIVELLDAILRPEQTTRVLLETMSGKGTEEAVSRSWGTSSARYRWATRWACASTPATSIRLDMISSTILTGCWSSSTGMSGWASCTPST